MDTLTILSIGVFLLGAALCAFFMVFLVRGKPLPGGSGSRQVIKYKDLELQTNSIMLILLVSAAVAVAPLALQYELRQKPQPTPPTREATIYLSGELKDGSDPTAKLANTRLTATNISTNVALNTQSDQEGHFDFEGIHITPEANRIKLLIKADKYSPVEKMIVADEQNIPITLTKVHE